MSMNSRNRQTAGQNVTICHSSEPVFTAAVGENCSGGRTAAGSADRISVRGVFSRSAFRLVFCLLLCLTLLTASLRVTVITAEASASSTLKVSGVKRPSSITEGSVFNVTGTVTSNYRIKKVTVAILNSKKKVVSSRTVHPNSYYYNLANVDDYILFNKAKAGKNYYKITAKDEKKTVVKNWAFTVKSRSSQSVSSSNNFLGYASYSGVNYKKQTGDSRRIAALDKAKKMATVKWRCALSFPTWYNSEGYYSTTKATDGTVSTQFLKGKTYVGIPYSMVNHSYDDSSWASLVKNGYSWSQVAASYYSSYYKTTAKGSDCSYFVYLCMRAAGANVTYQTTYMMYNGQYYKKINKSSLKPGDILLTYDHVRLYAGRVGEKYAVFEATGDGSKTRYKLFTKSQLSAYSAYRYKKW